MPRIIQMMRQSRYKHLPQNKDLILPYATTRVRRRQKLTQQLAHLIFVFDEQRKLVYRGQLDDSRPSNGKPVTGADLRAAIEAVLVGKPVTSDQKPSVGCNIKWKPGNQPSYFG